MVGADPSGADDVVRLPRDGSDDPIGNPGAGTAIGDQPDCGHGAP